MPPYIQRTMNNGTPEICIVSDGTLRMDGAALYGPIPRTIWGGLNPPDNKNRVLAGLNCVLIKAGGKNILVDTGVGTKYRAPQKNQYVMKAGELISDLRVHGLGVENIDIVVLTHLHFDHAGGCTRWTVGSKSVPTFPKATYLVQKQDWHEATHPNERTEDAYLPEDFMPLKEAGQLELVDGSTEIAPGVQLRSTGGHTSGHQMVLMESKDGTIVYPGDMVPTADHLSLGYTTGWDVHPTDTVAAKRAILHQGFQENWTMVFSHGVSHQAGKLICQDGQPSFLPREL